MMGVLALGVLIGAGYGLRLGLGAKDPQLAGAPRIRDRIFVSAVGLIMGAVVGAFFAIHIGSLIGAD